jgi:hypothetical protein
MKDWLVSFLAAVAVVSIVILTIKLTMPLIMQATRSL